MDSESSFSSDYKEELRIIAAFVAIDKENKSISRAWVYAINEKRETLGEFHRLIQELKKGLKRFLVYFDITMKEFDFLHELIKRGIYK